MVLPPPPLNRVGFGDHGKILLLPPPLNLLETTEKFCYYPPPPTESRRLGTSHQRGRLLRKILDLRLLTNSSVLPLVVDAWWN